MSDAEIPQVDPASRRRLPQKTHRSFTRRRRRSKAAFSIVDVAALRAKQLRRGARPRLDQAEEPLPLVKAIKAERVAMEEVKNNLVQWDLPDFKVVVDLR